MKQEIQTKEIEDIRGKKVKYLLIGTDDNKVIICIGEKTFNSLKKLENETTNSETSAPNSELDKAQHLSNRDNKKKYK